MLPGERTEGRFAYRASYCYRRGLFTLAMHTLQPPFRVLSIMPALHWLLAVFILVPLAEIYVLIQVGGFIGALPTVLLVVVTAVLGAVLFRLEGLATLTRVQDSMRRGEVPAEEMFGGVLLIFAGALLITPGFITDAIGFAWLLPPVRRACARWYLRRQRTVVFGASAGPSGRPHVIDGEYTRRDNDAP